MSTPAATKSLFVGGIPEDCTEALVRAAFIPFGDLVEVHVPLEHTSSRNKGFAFVEYADEKDAAAAMANMDGAELNGRTLRVNASRPRASKDKPVWFEAQQWFESLGKDGEGGGDGVGDGADAAPKAQ